MAISSNIEWTEATWNPISGCTVLSPGCTNCYAMRMAKRLEAMGQEKYKAPPGFQVDGPNGQASSKSIIHRLSSLSAGSAADEFS